MLKFVVFEPDGVEAGTYPPRHALLIGPDDIPHQGTVTITPGHVVGEKGAPQAGALGVQVPVGRSETSIVGPNGLGLLAIQTCLLPDKPGAYCLSIELARHRIMMFLNKLEDWGLVDLDPETPAMQQFEEARAQFTSALVAQYDPPPSGQLVDGYNPGAGHAAARALALAMHAGENLTMIQAERQLASRVTGREYAGARAHLTRLTPETPPAGAPVVAPGSGHVTLAGAPQIGCAVSPAQFGEGLQKALAASCDFLTMPMRWVDMEPVEGKYAFGPTDRWIEWAVRTAKMPVVAGPIIDFRPQAVPEWLFIWENDYETLRDLVFEHVQAVVTRYRRTVTRWTVASGLHVNTNFKISFEQIMDLTRVCVLLVRKLHPTAKIQVEIAQPWGEYHATNRRSIPPYLYADAVVQAGLNVDALGLRVQMGHAEPGLSTRDLMSFSALLDKYAALEKPIAITAIGAPSQPVPVKPYRPRAGADAEDAYEPGYWRTPWSESAQASWAQHMLAIACSKPYVQSVCWQELADVAAGGNAPEMPFGGLLAPNGAPKPIFARLVELRRALREGKVPPLPAL
ncbi:MAG: endo-1,4-beta-xylanase [Planctomycetota bacterium]|nr:endo-1,4-beta-xylanase [Planctomycetota bacterium]